MLQKDGRTDGQMDRRTDEGHNPPSASRQGNNNFLIQSLKFNEIAHMNLPLGNFQTLLDSLPQ